MRFLFQKHILLIKSRESYRLVGGPAEPVAAHSAGAEASAKAPQGQTGPAPGVHRVAERQPVTVGRAWPWSQVLPLISGTTPGEGQTL